MAGNMNKEGFLLFGGSCWECERFYYQFLEKEKIVGYVGYRENESFHGNSVSLLSEYDEKEKYYILIATDWRTFCQVRHELISEGLTEFDDFCYAFAYIKKIAVINANCYGDAYIEYLSKHPDFISEYYIYKVPFIHDNKVKHLPESLLKNCDLYIHQDIRPDNKYGYKMSDEYILPRLKPSCKHITVPNLVFFGRAFYPEFLQSKCPKINTSIRNRPQSSLFSGNIVIDEAYKNGKNWMN